MSACGACLARSAAIARLSPQIESSWKRKRVAGLLAMDEQQMLAALGQTQIGDLSVDSREQAAPGGQASLRAALKEHDVSVTCSHESHFPARLSDLQDLPAALYVKGSLELLGQHFGSNDRRPAVGIVGTRRASAEAQQTAFELGQRLAECGITVVSGMAFGVDAAAHRGALAAGERVGNAAAGTVAVLAGGVEVATPAGNRSLYGRIVEQGAVVSELPVGTTPRRWTFPARNRIIAALSDVVVIVEAAERSGSLITADLALNLGRIVAAVPGSVHSQACAGTNALLKEPAAEFVRGPEDVLELFDGLVSRDAATRKSGLEAPLGFESPAAQQLAKLLAEGPITVQDALANDSGGSLAIALVELELEGQVRRTLDGRISLARSLR